MGRNVPTFCQDGVPDFFNREFTQHDASAHDEPNESRN